MEVLLIQHAEATPKDVNPERPLSEKGLKDIRKIAKFLYHSGWQCKKILHSGKLRADQTAGHLLDAGFPNANVEATGGLSPNDPVAPVAGRLNSMTENTTLVGHLPFMEKLVSFLLIGRDDRTAVQFSQGGGVCLTRQEDGSWSICWMVIPELLGQI